MNYILWCQMCIPWLAFRLLKWEAAIYWIPSNKFKYAQVSMRGFQRLKIYVPCLVNKLHCLSIIQTFCYIICWWLKLLLSSLIQMANCELIAIVSQLDANMMSLNIEKILYDFRSRGKFEWISWYLHLWMQNFGSTNHNIFGYYNWLLSGSEILDWLSVV